MPTRDRRTRGTRAWMTVAVLLVLTMPSSASAAVLHDNGGLAPAPNSKSGVDAPFLSFWSEVQNDTGDLATSNSPAGYGANPGQQHLADDFSVPAGQTWMIENVEIFAYVTNAPATPSPVTAAALRIWRGRPGDPGSVAVFGDTSTSRLSSSTDTSLFRIFNSIVPPATAPGTTRKIWRNTLVTAPPLVLSPDTYWIQWVTQATAPAFHPSVTVGGTRGLTGWNARQLTLADGLWADVVDEGRPDTAPDVPQDFPFKVNGTIVAPPPPSLTATEPASPADNNSPKVKGSAAAGSEIKLYTSADCSGSPAASGSAADLAGPGIPVSVADNSTNAFRATATDTASTLSECSDAVGYQEITGSGTSPDSTPPSTDGLKGPKRINRGRLATFRFSSSEAGSTFRCRLDKTPYKACSSPRKVKTGKLDPKRKHSFRVYAIDPSGNVDASPAKRAFESTRSNRYAEAPFSPRGLLLLKEPRLRARSINVAPATARRRPWPGDRARARR